MTGQEATVPDEPREPRAAAAVYMRDLTTVSRSAQLVIDDALSPLLAIWPSEREDSDEYNQLEGASRRPAISSLSDDDLERLWPGQDPDGVRAYAPWATSRRAVRRIMPSGELTDEDSVERYVARAIDAGRAARPGLTGIQPSRRTIRGRVPVVLGPGGIPLPPPPRPSDVTQRTVAKQLEHAAEAVGHMITQDALDRIVDAQARRLDRFSLRELRRILAIDLRREIPGLQGMIDRWRSENVRLIESGIVGPDDGVRLRPLLEDVSEVVERAHAEGIRVEHLSRQLVQRYGVSESRAQLIARDQTLKLNGRISAHRQQDAGIERYRWSTSRDERTRREHARLNGTVHRWSEPPSVGRGRHAHPGQDIQCRCVAVPILPDA